MTEEQITTENIQKPFKIQTKERREKILEFMKKVGVWNLDIKLLAKQFEVSERTIYSDIDWIKGHYQPEDLRTIRMQLDVGSKRAFNQAMMAVTQAQSIGEKTQSIDALIKSMKAYREELEAWGYKDKKEETIKFIIERQNERVSPKTES